MKNKWTLAQVRKLAEAQWGGTAEGLKSLGSGEWSTAYAFNLRGVPLVLRIGKFRGDFNKDRVMGQYASPILPIPRILEVGEAGGGDFFCLAERAYGTYLDNQDGAGMREALPHLLLALEATRHISLADKGYGTWRSDGVAPYPTWREALLAIGDDSPDHRLSGWRHRLEISPVGADAFDSGLRTLERLTRNLAPDPAIIHGDLLHRNVLVSGGRLSAVLDWGNSLIGDPLYDAAWLVFWWPWYPAWAAINVETFLRSRYHDIPQDDWDRRMACCCIHIALDAQAYSAFRGRFDSVRVYAERTRDLVSRWTGTGRLPGA